MDEGDEYVPQMSQLGGDYGAPTGMGYPGMMGAPSMPSNPYGDPQMMHPMQQMHQMQPQQAAAPPPQAPPPKATKSRSKKKQQDQQQQQPPAMDPMQSMAAMSHNPMMRSGMGQMTPMEMQQRQQQMQMYGSGPPGGPPAGWPSGPQNPYGAPPSHPSYGQRQYPPQGYPQHMQPPHMYPGQGQQRPGSGPYPGGPPANPYGYPGSGYPPQQGNYPMPQRYPGQPQYPGYQMDQQGYPGYPPAQQPASAQSDSRMSQTSTAQGMPPTQSSQADPWSAQQQQQQQQSQQPPHGYAGQQPGTPNPQALQMELQQCQQRLQQFYQQPRTPIIEQEIMQYERRIGFLQNQLASTQQQPPGTPTYPQSQGSVPNQGHPHMGGQQGPHGPQGAPAPPGIAHPDPSVLIQQHGANQQQGTPVSVTQSGSQVQVNIKPEVPGRTLISVYHQYGEGGPEGSFNENAGKDSVPPEPTPSQQQPKLEISSPQHMPSQSNSTGPPQQQQYQQYNSNSQPSVPPSMPPHSMYNGVTPVSAQSSLSNGSMTTPSHISNMTAQPTTSQAYGMPMEPPVQNQSQPPANPYEVKEACVKTEPETPHPETIQSSEEMAATDTENPYEIDRDATPPMRVDAMSDGAEDISSEKIDGGMSIMSDETQPALERTDNDTSREEEEQEQKPEPMESTSQTDQENHVDEEIAPPPSTSDRRGTLVKEESSSDTEPPVETMDMVETEDKDSEPSESDQKSSDSIIKEEESVHNGESPDKGGSVESEDREEKEDQVEEPERSEATMDSASRADSVSVSADFEGAEPSEDTMASNDIPVKKSKPPRAPKAKKKKMDDDFSGGEDDDDFMFETKTSKSRPRKPAKKKAAAPVVQAPLPEEGDAGFDEIPPEFLLENEKRRSGRSAGSKAPKSYKEPRADEFDELMVAPTPSTIMNEEDSIEGTEMGEFVEQQVVEKFLNIRGEGDSEELLVKWKGKSYLHVEWKTQAQLEEIDKRVAAKIKRFKQKRAQAFELDDEDFNSDFTIVDRVVDISESEEGAYALIKWRSLPYDEVTWESIDVVPEEKVELWRKRQIIDKKKVKEKPRPIPSEWKKISDELEWKDGNRLREYQFEGVNWLLYCYYGRQNCILADEMGLGKTVQTITFLSQVYEYGIHGPFLIVVPLSTVQNWVREFETWTDMNAIVYHGSGTARNIIQQNEIFYTKPVEQDSKLWRKNLVKLDALITTFEMVVTDCEFLKKINWKVCVIDEAHRLKNRNCKLLTGGLLSFKMEHRVLLTGTPLQNNIEELFNLLNFLHPEKFPSSVSFLEQFGQCQTDQQVQELQEMLKPMMLRRLKEDVEKSLQPREEVIIEVQLSDTQKKYYRAILERNFSHLCKGANAPALMNVMMELRKCCNHPFLIQGAEEQIISESKLLHPEWDDEAAQKKLLVDASGKMVLIEKLLPKLRADGHRVLIFSQMVKVLDLIEEFLMNMNYTFERIDGNVRGDLRQAAIDRYSKKDSDRFVFLLCTRAGGLGINLTAADTVIIFDSDWNPQNDLQAQARCHRIGQKKMVKVYRLITANTYEREMFDKASLKLGLDKAVLQSTTALEKPSTSLSRKEVEELLKKGAYGTLMDESNEGSKFSEEDIETILQRRTQTITLEAGVKGSTFSKAAFGSSNNTDSIDINDPNFWNKWAEKANVDMEKAKEKAGEKQLIVHEPRQRKKRFEENELSKQGEDSDSGSEEGRGRGGKRVDKKKRRRGADDDDDYVTYRPDELAFNKSDYFKVEKLMATWGWGRWTLMKDQGELEVNELDIEHMGRTLLLHCIREFRGDDKTREYVWKLIEPRDAKHPKVDPKNKYTSGWAALPEFNPPNFALDSTFQRHVHRHSNKLLVKIEQLHYMERDIIGSHAVAINAGKKWSDVPLKLSPLAEPLCPQWDSDCDKCLIIGIYKHGLDNYENMRADQSLCFEEKKIEIMPLPAELAARFRRLVAVAQRAQADTYEKGKWSRREETEFLRVLGNYGMKDKKGDPSKLDWDTFRTFSPALEKKGDDEIQDYLYAVLAACTKFQGGEVTTLDLKRTISNDLLSAKKATKLMNRLQLLRKIHHIGNNGFDEKPGVLKHCSTEAMPSGWSQQHDKELIAVAHLFGIDNISANILSRPIFQKIIRPTEKTLLRRIVEICTTFETGKWNGTANIESIEDSDDESDRRRREQVAAASATRRGGAAGGRKRGAAAAEASKEEKLRALMQQSMLGVSNLSGARPEELQLAAALMAQSLMMPQLNVASASLLSTLFAMPSTSSASSSSAASLSAQVQAAEDALNLSASSSKTATTSKAKEPTASTSASSSASAASLAAHQQAAAAAMMSGMNINELFALASLPQETRIPVVHSVTKERLMGESAPRVRNLGQWLAEHPQYHMDLASIGKPEKPSTPSRTPKVSTPRPSATPTPSTPKPPSTPREATPKPSTLSPKLEPGEIPKTKTATVTVTAEATPADTLVCLFSRSTGNLLPVPNWPPLSKLSAFLDKNQDFNVHSSHVAQAKAIVGKTHPERLGGDGVIALTPVPAVTPATPVRSTAPTPSSSMATPVAATSSSSTSLSANNAAANSANNAAATAAAIAALAGSMGLPATPSTSASSSAASQKQTLEAIQMQMLLQQSMLQQSLMASYPFLGASSSSKPEDLLNNPALMMSLMGMSMPGMNMNSLGAMGGLANLAMLDPATLAALTQASTPSSSSKKRKE